MLLQGINPRVVAERLGRSGVAITLDRYSHVLPSLQAMVADRLDEVFGGWNGATDRGTAESASHDKAPVRAQNRGPHECWYRIPDSQ